MSSEPVQSSVQSATSSEIVVERKPVPIWLFILLFMLLYWGMLYFDLHGGWFDRDVYAPYMSVAHVAEFQPVTDGPDLGRGKAVYDMVCGLCHNPDGMGKPNQAPALAGSEWVLVEKPDRLIRIPLYGLIGPITVKGEVLNFPSGMLAMGATLSDEDLALVLSYMRQAWGNKAPPVTPEQIKKVKAEVGARQLPFTEEELMKIPDK